MIDKVYGKYELICDVCGESAGSFDMFHESVEYKTTEGWKTRMVKGQWLDYCPECGKAK